MFGPFLTLFVMLLLIASFLHGDFALTLLYLIVGALAAALWWCYRALGQGEAKRRFNTHAFLGEKAKIGLREQNNGWLPLLWLELRERLPGALAGPHSFESVTNLGARGTST